MENQIDLNDLYTVQQLAQQYPGILSVPTLRWQLRWRDANGLAKACVKMGKKLLISKSRYQAWLAQSAEAGAALTK